MKKAIIFSLIWFWTANSQTIKKYYVNLFDYSNPPTFSNINGELLYNGNDLALLNFFSNFEIYKFEQAFPTSPSSIDKEVFYIESGAGNLGEEMINNFPQYFRYFTDITNVVYELNDFYPNDYGSTNPNGNSGMNVNRHDLDYINVSKAWDITTGIGVKLGVSDARVNPNDIDFSQKLTLLPVNNSFQNLSYNSGNPFTYHGTQVAGIAVAQGNNGNKSTGVCYDCKLFLTPYGNYNNLLLLAQSGVRVINMSWSSFFYVPQEQELINTIVQNYNTVLVASAGNRTYQTNSDFRCGDGFSYYDSSLQQFVPNYTGEQIGYPASYENVISVSSIGHFYEANDPTTFQGVSPLNISVSNFIRDSFSPNVDVTDPANPIGLKYHGWTGYCQSPSGSYLVTSPNGVVITTTWNDFVDILAPGYSIPNFPKLSEENVIAVYDGGGTSSATPYVSGTAALMISVNKCLTPNEVDQIIKLTSKNVLSGSINQNFTGKIGAGALNSGDAVEFVNEMKKSNGVAKINDHIFNRFNFDLNKINNILELSNVIFSQKCTANFEAKNEIKILPGTTLSPNNLGFVRLGINSNIDITCDTNFFAKVSEIQTNNQISQKNPFIAPNPNNGDFTVYDLRLSDFYSDIVNITVYDLNGRSLYKTNFTDNQANSIPISINDLASGIYIINFTSPLKSYDVKFVKN